MNHPTFCLSIYVFLILSFFISSPIAADGGFFSHEAVAVSADQRAIIIAKGDKISITFSTVYTGDGGEFAWIIPTPVPPDIDDIVESGDIGEQAFNILDDYTAPYLTTSDGCFTAGTLVLTPEGPRGIETLISGMDLIAYDMVGGTWTVARVTRLGSYDYDGDMITIRAGGETVEVTGNHPILVIRGDELHSRSTPSELKGIDNMPLEMGKWVEARNLRIGDVLRSHARDEMRIDDLSTYQLCAVVYHLEVESHHNFAVSGSGILVHNGGEKDDSGGEVMEASSAIVVYGQVDLEHYDVSVLGADDPVELLLWLEDNGYRLNPGIRDTLGAYIVNGWAFVAVRLNIDGHRRYVNEYLPPITVIYRHNRILFPLRISSVSSQSAVRITLFVISRNSVTSSSHTVADRLNIIPEEMVNPSTYIESMIRKTQENAGADLVRIWSGMISEKGRKVGERSWLDIQKVLGNIGNLKSLWDMGMWGDGFYVTRFQTFIDPSEMDRDIEFVWDENFQGIYLGTYAPEGWGPDISVAAWKGDVMEIRKLTSTEVNLEEGDYLGRTPLIIAAERGHVEVVMELLHSGADVNSTDNGGRTALRYATGSYQYPVVELLLEVGADADIEDQYGFSTRDWVERSAGNFMELIEKYDPEN